MQRIGAGYFDPESQQKHNLLGMSIWPGHETKLYLKGEGALLLQVQSVH
jgi:hypothetical protein